MDDFEFLYSEGLSGRIRDVCRGSRVRCAVAFLGQGVKAQLFPDGIGDVEILCDISMNATSRWALMEFGAPTSASKAGNPKLKVHDGLHGKMYLSSLGMVMGSPNMSTRGLGRTLKGDWNCETGVFCPPGSAAWKKASEWFDAEFHNRSAVSWKDVERAATVARDAGRPPKPEELVPSVFSRVFDFPSTFDNVLFVVSDESILDNIEKARKRTHAEQSRQGLHSGVDRDSIVHDEPHVLKGLFDRAVVFWMPEKARDHEILAYVDIVPVPYDNADTLFGLANWKQAWRTLGEAAPSRHDAIVPDRATALRLLEHGGSFVGDAAALRERLEQIGFEPAR